MTEPTKLSQSQLRALFAKKKGGITLQAKGTIPIKSKLVIDDKVSRVFDVEKIQGIPDTVVVREKGSERGVLTTRKDLNKTLERIRKERKKFPPNEVLR